MNLPEQQSARSFLRKCTAAYESLVAYVLRLEVEGDDEKTLRWIGLAAGIGWTAHPGRYSDGRLEALALRIGGRLPSMPADEAPDAFSRNAPRPRVLHVATTVYDTGGHTRLIENWVTSGADMSHSLVLLDQRQNNVRPELIAGVAESGGKLILLPAVSTLIDQARRLRSVAQSGYDCVILHHHPYDVVPLAALATVDCPPVAVMNHADHIYWLGVSIADIVIDFRHYGSRLSRERRGARQSLLLPMPIDIGSPTIDREQARERLGIAPTEVILLSIGSAYKYKATATHDFFRTLDMVLEANPSARAFIIGVNEDDIRAFGARRNPRVELLGIIQDISLYQAAADLYLESFPYGSYTALIETAARGVCPVLMYAPKSHTDVSGDVPLNALIASPSDSADYVRRVSALIDDPAERTRLGQAVARQIASIHGPESRRRNLEAAVRRLVETSHRSDAIGYAPSAETEDDLTLAFASGARIKSAVLAQVWPDAVARMPIAELLKLAAISIRSGDTRLLSRDMKSWIGLLWRRAFQRSAKMTG